MDDLDHTAYTEKIDELAIRNKKLEKDNRNLIKTVRHYKRVISGYKKKLEEKEKRDKQHYRNGRKRGGHGMNG